LTATGAAGVWRVVHERNVARRGRTAAEELVQFMIGDLAAKLKSVGRLDLLENVGDRIDAYYDRVPDARDLDTAALARRGEARATIGDVRRARGQLDRAGLAYDENLRLARRLVAAAPQDGERQRTLFEALKRRGELYKDEGRFDEARAGYGEMLQLARTLAAASPRDDENAQAMIATALDHIGLVEIKRSHLDAALAAFSDGLAVCQHLAQLYPGKEERYVSTGFERVGVVKEAQGDVAGAIAAYRSEVAYVEPLARAAADDTQLQWNLTAGRNHLASALELQFKFSEARDLYQRGVPLLTRVLRGDPTNLVWQEALIQQLNVLGGADEEFDDLDGALAAYRRSLLAVVASDPDNAEWQAVLANDDLKLSQVLQRRGDRGAAMTAARAALGIAEREATRDASTPGPQILLADCALQLADLLRVSVAGRAEALVLAGRARASLAGFRGKLDHEHLAKLMTLERAHASR
jgi:tetratricopeptide (TPR) repeat protein